MESFVIVVDDGLDKLVTIAQCIFPVSWIFGCFTQGIADMLWRFKVRCTDKHVIQCTALFLQGNGLFIQRSEYFIGKAFHAFTEVHTILQFI